MRRRLPSRRGIKSSRRSTYSRAVALGFEWLEQRALLAADFGDAPEPYPTLLAANGASHEAIGPTLGALRDTEADGTPSGAADADGPDDDGVTFGTIRVGQLGATVTVNVQNAPTGAKLDAWIDFNGDGNWGGATEHIADSVSVVNGNKLLKFDVPSNAVAGATFARFRLSTAGNLGVGGAAADGEVEDYAISIATPTVSSGNFGPQHVISTAANSADDIYAADIDRDGDMDVLSASAVDRKIAWYRHNNNGTFTARNINLNADGAQSVHVADIDGDGDLDALSASATDAKITWYQSSGPPNINTWTGIALTTAATQARDALALDLDGDGDFDIVSGGHSGVAWYENDGSQNFTSREIVNFLFGNALDVDAADFDGDGDLDILSSYDDQIAWHINDGTPAVGNWTTQFVEHNSANSFGESHAADIDGDGDIDVVVAARGSQQILWYENDGTVFWTPRTITSQGISTHGVYSADMDGDGDLDVLAAADVNGNGNVSWYENDGIPDLGEWTPHLVTTNIMGANGVHAADMDGDGDLDVFSASWFDNKIAWYENLASMTGDYDRDLDVDLDDRDTWQSHFGETSGSGLAADGNGNNVVDAADYVIWRKVYGNGGGGGGVGATVESTFAFSEPVAANPSALVADRAHSTAPVPANMTRTVLTPFLPETLSNAPASSARTYAVDRLFQRVSPSRIDLLVDAHLQATALRDRIASDTATSADAVESSDADAIDAAFDGLHSAIAGQNWRLVSLGKNR